jgi:NAD(P)-dependent dehydrogenase (short-subunit alcohol dehydrogenase family)
MNLKGAVTVVTGSSSGLGAAAAKLLAGKGCRVVVNYSKSAEEAEKIARDCRAAGSDAIVVKADVAEDRDCRRLAQAALDKWGRIDALINNAGTTKFAPASDLDTLDAGDFQRIYGVNVIGTYQMTRAVAPAMKKAGRGAVVNVSSIASTRGSGSSLAYAASKGALNTLTIGLARALAPEIRVNAILPGFFDSPWLRGGLGQTFDEAKARVEASAALGRAGTPEDMAEVAVALIECADYVTGQLLPVEGGQLLAVSTAYRLPGKSR